MPAFKKIASNQIGLNRFFLQNVSPIKTLLFKKCKSCANSFAKIILLRSFWISLNECQADHKSIVKDISTPGLALVGIAVAYEPLEPRNERVSLLDAASPGIDVRVRRQTRLLNRCCQRRSRIERGGHMRGHRADKNVRYERPRDSSDNGDIPGIIKMKDHRGTGRLVRAETH